MVSDRSRYFCFVTVVIVLALCSFGAAWGQGYGVTAYEGTPAESYGTPNLPCATAWAAEEMYGWVEGRFFDGDNYPLAAGLRAAVGESSEAQLTLWTMDTSGKDPISGVVRQSEGTLLGLNYKWLAHKTERVTVSVMPGFDYPIQDLEATNTNTGDTASSDELIPVVSVPIEWQGRDGVSYRVVPRYVGFDNKLDNSAGDAIDGFGDCIALGAGVLYEDVEYSLMADVQVPISGDNAIDDATNTPTDEVVWSAGGAWHGADSDVRIEATLTNAFGPTGATSLMATPDQSVGVGIRVSSVF